MLLGLMIKAFQRLWAHPNNMASIDKISGDEVIEECLLSVLSESLRNGKLAKQP